MCITTGHFNLDNSCAWHINPRKAQWNNMWLHLYSWHIQHMKASSTGANWRGILFLFSRFLFLNKAECRSSLQAYISSSYNSEYGSYMKCFIYAIYIYITSSAVPFFFVKHPSKNLWKNPSIFTFSIRTMLLSV